MQTRDIYKPKNTFLNMPSAQYCSDRGMEYPEKVYPEKFQNRAARVALSMRNDSPGLEVINALG